MEPNQDNAGLARQMCERGLWPDVLALAQEWQKENPADYQAWFYLGLGLSGTNQFVEAETAYRRALALNASDARVWNNLAGILYEKLNQRAEAIRCMEQALKIDPDNKTGWSNLAAMAGRLGHHDRAMAYAERALALDPKLVEAQLHKGAAAVMLKRVDIVKEVCHALAAIEPENFRRAR